VGAEPATVPLDPPAGERRAQGDDHQSLRRRARPGEAKGRDVPDGGVCDRAGTGGGSREAQRQLNAEFGMRNAELTSERRTRIDPGIDIPHSALRIPHSSLSLQAIPLSSTVPDTDPAPAA